MPHHRRTPRQSEQLRRARRLKPVVADMVRQLQLVPTDSMLELLALGLEQAYLLGAIDALEGTL